MKKLLISIGLIAAVASQAANHTFYSFLQYNSTLPLKNSDYVSVLITNGGPGLALFNVPAFPSPSTGIISYVVGNNYPSFINITTPLIAYSTNYIGGQTNGTIGATTGFTNVTQVAGMISSYNPEGYQLFGTNLYLVQATSGISNSAGNITGSPFIPITIPAADANGIIQTNTVFVFGFAGDSTTSTNSTNRVVFAKSYDGNVYDMVNTNSVTATLNGTNEVLAVWQPSASWMAGVKAVAIYQIFCGTNTGSTNTWLTKAGIASYIP